MDTLTFGSNVLLRHLTFSEARKMPISEIHLEKTLSGLQMTMDQVASVIEAVHSCVEGDLFLDSSLTCAYYLGAIIVTPSRELDPKRPLN